MTDALHAVLRRIEAGRPGGGRRLVAVDGVGGSGKTVFAGRLAAALAPRPVVLLHVDDFLAPPAVRHARGRYAPEGHWLDAYDLAALVDGALEPLREGRPAFLPAPAAEPVPAPQDAVVVVEGVFLHRDALRDRWDASVWLHVPLAVAAVRMVRRGTIADAEHDPLAARYAGAQRLYFAEAAPWERASLVVDNTDWTRPRIIDPQTAGRSIDDGV